MVRSGNRASPDEGSNVEVSTPVKVAYWDVSILTSAVQVWAYKKEKQLMNGPITHKIKTFCYS